jgi:hypothetical protein
MADAAASQLGPGKFGLPLMDTDDLYSLYAQVIGEVTQGTKPDTSKDTPAMAAWRAHLKKEVAAIIAKGGTPDVPHEW